MAGGKCFLLVSASPISSAVIHYGFLPRSGFSVPEIWKQKNCDYEFCPHQLSDGALRASAYDSCKYREKPAH